MRFETLWRENRKGLMGLAQSLTRNADDADDLYQRTAIRALGVFSRYSHERPFANWAMRIMSRLWMDELRLRHRSPLTVSSDAPIDGMEGDVCPEFPDPSPSALDLLATKAFSEKALARLRRLPMRRRWIVMAWVAGLSPAEIGERFGIAKGTVRSAIHRCRRVA